MRAVVALRLPIAWLFLAAIIAAAVFVLWKVAILDAPPANSLLISTPATTKSTTPSTGQGKAEATITALTEALATLQAPQNVAAATVEQPLSPPTPSPTSGQTTLVIVSQNGGGPLATPTAPEVATALVPVGASSPTAEPDSAQPEVPQGKVNINTADAEQLERLPGIGPVLAARIVEYRRANGPFQRPEDIMQVSGIKEGIYGGLRDQITVVGP